MLSLRVLSIWVRHLGKEQVSVAHLLQGGATSGKAGLGAGQTGKAGPMSRLSLLHQALPGSTEPEAGWP